MPLLSSLTEQLPTLVVEDDPVAAMMLLRLLKGHGLEADHAKSGTEALDMHHRRPYRLVVSDWMMPGMDGIELCRAFRNSQASYVYFILCSAKGQREDRRQAFEAGVDDFVSKPVDRDELHSRLIVARRILAAEDVLNRQADQLKIHAHRLAEMNGSLQLSSNRFAELFNGLPVAGFTFDTSGVVHEWNREAEQVFGITGSETLMASLDGLFPNSPWTTEFVERVFTGDAQPQFDWTLENDNGSRKYLTCNVITLGTQVGRPVGAICAILDITARREAEQRIAEQRDRLNEYAEQVNAQKDQLEQVNAELALMNKRLNHLVATDALTGLWNRRRFQEAVTEVAEAHQRLNRPFSLILMDIDHFKRINDDFGHQIGDETLRMFARIIQRTSRGHEVAARYGGEEFAVILQHCDVEEAKVAAERFRSTVEVAHWPHRAVTVSIGVSTWKAPEGSIDTLVAEADEALYAAKQSGRNKTVHYGDTESALARLVS